MHADVSWDVLSKQLLMNYDPRVHNISLLHEVIFILVVIMVIVVVMVMVIVVVMLMVIVVMVMVIVVIVYPKICYLNIIASLPKTLKMFKNKTL